MRLFILFIIILLLPLSIVTAQETIKGKILAQEKNKQAPLPAANVYFINSTMGTVSDVDGNFQLQYDPKQDSLLLISFTGFRTDSVNIVGKKYIEVVLKSSLELKAVEVQAKEHGAYTSMLNPIQTEKLSQKELTKAACCNLSESFETTPTVDVSYSDAVTGAKEIKMLGLAGTYTQLLVENMPYMRGPLSAFGITYLPGTWMESIYVSKGTGSVVNGYEAITGQINVELQEPHNSERLFVNLYSDEELRTEANVHLSHRFSNKVSTILLTHGAMSKHTTDENSDGFTDMPLYERYNVLNRWHFTSGNWEGQLSLNILGEDRTGGQLSFIEGSNGYGVEIDNRRWEIYAKSGYVIEPLRNKSIGLMFSANGYEMNGFFGTSPYSGVHRNIYSGLLFQNNIFSPEHLLTTGLSLNYDQIDESYKNINLQRKEVVPGVFGEYSYVNEEKFKLLGGARLDYNNIYGVFFIPKLNIRYSITPETVLRANAGRGYRTPNILAENTELLVSSRNIVLEEDLLPETGWNIGGSFSRKFKALGRHGSFTADYYHIEFQNQAIIDMDQHVDAVHIYNLKGRSFSNSFQAQVDYEVINRMDVRLAYKYNDVQTTYEGELLQKPLVPKHFGLINISYATPFDKWIFDVTGQFTGTQRLPSTTENPEKYQKPEFAPQYFTMLAQITKKFKNLELYLGGENLTGFRQKDVIIAPEDPFGPYFDASMVWGPVTGRKIYAGLRYSLPYKK